MTDTTRVNAESGISNFEKYKDAFKNAESNRNNDSSSVFKDNQISHYYRLSGTEIAESCWNSTKKFVKGMFCDENGFSIERTATTVGTIAALTLSAPLAAKLGASVKAVKAIGNTTKLAGYGLGGYMVYNGVPKIDEGYSRYKYAKSKEEAKASMELITDGSVEVATALPAFLCIKKGANAGKKIAEKNAESKPVTPEAEAPELRASESEPIIPEPDPSLRSAEPDPIIPEPAPETEPIITIKVEDEAPTMGTRTTEVKPIEEPKPLEETQPPRQQTKLPEQKSLSDKKNVSEFVDAVLKENQNGATGIRLIINAIKEYNSPEFTVAQLETALLDADSSAGLNGLRIFIHNNKIMLDVENINTIYTLNIKAK